MKTSELTGAALDWAVGTAMKLPPPYWADGKCASFSTDWAQGGPIIEREKIGIERCIHAGEYHGWRALKDYPFDASVPEETTWGDTPLIAAMRCYVASKMGDNIDIPEELK